jgi:hypothetical protein
MKQWKLSLNIVSRRGSRINGTASCIPFSDSADSSLSSIHGLGDHLSMSRLNNFSSSSSHSSDTEASQQLDISPRSHNYPEVHDTLQFVSAPNNGYDLAQDHDISGFPVTNGFSPYELNYAPSDSSHGNNSSQFCHNDSGGFQIPMDDSYDPPMSHAPPTVDDLDNGSLHITVGNSAFAVQLHGRNSADGVYNHVADSFQTNASDPSSDPLSPVPPLVSSDQHNPTSPFLGVSYDSHVAFMGFDFGVNDNSAQYTDEILDWQDNTPKPAQMYHQQDDTCGPAYVDPFQSWLLYPEP